MGKKMLWGLIVIEWFVSNISIAQESAGDNEKYNMAAPIAYVGINGGIGQSFYYGPGTWFSYGIFGGLFVRKAFRTELEFQQWRAMRGFNNDVFNVFLGTFYIETTDVFSWGVGSGLFGFDEFFADPGESIIISSAYLFHVVVQMNWKIPVGFNGLIKLEAFPFLFLIPLESPGGAIKLVIGIQKEYLK